MQSQHNRPRPQAQTIDEIDARASKIRADEQDALYLLAHFMRELAVRCPPEGRLALRLANSATTIEMWGTADNPETGAACGVLELCRDLALDWPDLAE